MNIIAVTFILFIGVTGFFIWANKKTQRQHARFTKCDVIAALENVISGDSVIHDEWDLFLTWPIRDPYLESLRKRCLDISSNDVNEPGRDLSIAGVEKVRSILNELHDRV